MALNSCHQSGAERESAQTDPCVLLFCSASSGSGAAVLQLTLHSVSNSLPSGLTCPALSWRPIIYRLILLNLDPLPDQQARDTEPMLFQCWLRRWPNIETTLAECFVLAGSPPKTSSLVSFSSSQPSPRIPLASGWHHQKENPP